MASNHRQGGNGEGGDGNARQRPPEWADGLKQLYDSVVEEALPDNFRDLLDRLDAMPSKRGGSESPSGTPDSGR